MVNVMEMFYSVQGEGLRAGRPSIFLRTGLCNFSCKGFGVKYKDQKTGEEKCGCDSFYAVDSSFKKNWTPYTNYLELVNDMDSVVPDFGKHSLTKADIVLTGGEPLIYWEDPVYQRMISHYISRGHKVTIETNGSMSIEFTREYQKQIIFSASVKLSVSGEPEHKRFNIDTITKIAENSPESYLKFVTSKKSWEQDNLEILSFLAEIPVYIDVYLMPLGDVQSTLEENAKFVAEQAMKLGYNYSDRIHIRMWNNTPGV